MAKLAALPTAEQALPGRAQPVPTAAVHFVKGHALKPPFPVGLEDAVFGLGCFWGAERKFWQTEGGTQYRSAIYTTSLAQKAAAEKALAA